MNVVIKSEFDYNKTHFHEGAFETIITDVCDDLYIPTVGPKKGIAEDRVKIEFTATEDPYKGEKIVALMSPFITPGSKLTKIIIAAIGRKFTVEEMVSIHTVDELKPHLMNYPIVIFVKIKFYGKNSYPNVFEFMRSKYFDMSKHYENALVPPEHLPLDLREPKARVEGEEEARKAIENIASGEGNSEEVYE